MSTITAPRTPAASARRLAPAARLGMMATLACLGVLAFFALDSGGDLAFTFAFRSQKVWGMALVGWATGVATVAFQTVTNNRILTPSVMGMDALYAFVQTLLLFLLGSTIASALGPTAMFGINLLAMLAFGMVLASLLTRRRIDVHAIVLIGIVLGAFLRSLQSLLTRMMDPTSFLMLQGNLFASFNALQPQLLVLSTALVVMGSAWLWWRRHELDVMSLGPAAATGLGVRPAQMTREVLVVAVVLVSVCTALVGPITFLGLIVANIAVMLAGSGKHQWTLPMAGLLGLALLVGGQAVLEHGFGYATVLSVVIEFGGGLVFLWLVIAGNRMKERK